MSAKKIDPYSSLVEKNKKYSLSSFILLCVLSVFLKYMNEAS